MYYITKEAVFDHGVFWIGDNLAEGIAKCISLASTDIDDHHYWEVRSHRSISWSDYEGHVDEYEIHFSVLRSDAIKQLSEAANAAKAI